MFPRRNKKSPECCAFPPYYMKSVSWVRNLGATFHLEHRWKHNLSHHPECAWLSFRALISFCFWRLWGRLLFSHVQVSSSCFLLANRCGCIVLMLPHCTHSMATEVIRTFCCQYLWFHIIMPTVGINFSTLSVCLSACLTCCLLTDIWMTKIKCYLSYCCDK